MSGYTVEEQSNSHLRWEVYGPVFGREFLLAAFLTEHDAQAWVAMRTTDPR